MRERGENGAMGFTGAVARLTRDVGGWGGDEERKSRQSSGSVGRAREKRSE